MKTGAAKRSVLAAVLLFIVAACGGFPNEFPASDFTLPDIMGGQPVKFADYKGRPVIIYWLTSW